MDIKENDVFSFRYNEETIEKMKKFTGDPYHCFDGKLVAKNYSGGIRLVDTYWGSGDNRTFTPTEAQEKGTLTFICNLNEVTKIKENDLKYYAHEDVFDLSHQHGCYSSYAIKHETQRSKDRMLEVANKKKSDAIYKIEWGQRELEQATKLIAAIESGDLNVYL